MQQFNLMPPAALRHLPGVSIQVARGGLYHGPNPYRSRPVEWEETVHADTGLLGLPTEHSYFSGPRKRMTFPDQSHINRVRDALWQRSGNGASVMVGSGFSRNSVPSGPQVVPLPTWEEVTRRLHAELYPQEDTASYPDQLRTAQEYEAAFGRGALHDALRRLVRHEEHHPGEPHKRLLQLPWVDIYTTNWDTLLERTRSNVFERHYSVVNSLKEIPMGKRPRIVKLHGSFPAQFPLIVTEEDYRMYPANVAPFVNTVQQAMMETVFLLVGFSGDDPNFLKWSGWVRDNLGPSTPKIYLAGYLKLSPHRQRMLEGHHIVPIDLAKHPNADRWPENAFHEYAIQWLLHTLENGEPYKVTEWPGLLNPRRRPIPDFLQPVDKITTTWPKEEPNPPRSAQDAQDVDLAQEVRKATVVWEHNRKMYPGWLVLPASNRHSVSRDIDSWASATLDSIELFTPTERLQTIRELVWRKKILLEPFSQELLDVTESTLAMFDCHNRTIDGEETPGADWKVIREAWRNTAAAVLFVHRLDHNQEAFGHLIEDLRKFADEDPEIQQCIFQEQCLWALYDSDFEELHHLLADWQPENYDAVWAMRKSAMLSEVGRDDEAEQLRRQATETIRAMPTDDQSLAGPSLEGWAILPTFSLHNHQALSGRLDELGALKCDAAHERDVIARGIDRSRQEENPPSFDVHTRTVQHSFHSTYPDLVAAYRVIRLAEVTGLPPRLTVLHNFSDGQLPVRLPTDVAATILKQAAEKLVGWNHELAIRLALRACSSDTDATLGRVLTRTLTATLTTQQAENLAQSCRKAIAKAIHSLEHPTYSSRFDVAIEALSRLVVRLPPDQVEAVFGQALELCQNQQLARGTWWTPIGHLLHRSWESLTADYRNLRAIDLLNAPIAGLDGPSPFAEYECPDPADVLIREGDVLRRTPDNEQQWLAAVDLVERSLSGNPSARHRASARMSCLVQSGQLTDVETLRIAHALWNEQYTPPDELPSGVVLYDWAFLTFPEPTPGVAQERFHKRWLSGDVEISSSNTIQIRPGSNNGLNHDPKDVKSRLWQVGHAIRSLRPNGQQLELSDGEKQHLAEMLETWADTPTPERHILEAPMFRGGYSNQARAVAQVLPAVIREIDPPAPSTGEKIYEKMRHLSDLQIPVFDLSATVVTITPTRLEDVATMLRVGITSNSHELATSAASGIRLWLSESSGPESDTPVPPRDLIREIGVAIAYRRATSLVGALQEARWIFESGTGASKEAIRQLVEDGLDYLGTELSYDRDHENPDDIPLLRRLCTELAVEMAKDGQHQHPAIVRWLESAKEDPLPEVRDAVGEWKLPTVGIQDAQEKGSDESK